MFLRSNGTGGACWKQRAQKTLGTLLASPSLPLQQVLSASCCFSSSLSFWLPWIYSPFPFFMESCNGRLLQLIECIESTHNEVKKKMIESSARIDAPKSPRVHSPEEKNRHAIPLLFSEALARLMLSPDVANLRCIATTAATALGEP
jgi:hypothetical protein